MCICPKGSKGITICLTFNQGQLKLLYHVYRHAMNHRREVTAEKKVFVSIISCKLHIFCVIWKESQNTVYLFLSTEAASMHLPQAKEKMKQATLSLVTEQATSSLLECKTPNFLDISPAHWDKTVQEGIAVWPLSTDNKHNKHMGCISVVRRADKFLIYLMLSEAGSILWLKGPLKTRAFVRRLFYHHGKKCIQRSLALRLGKSVGLQPSSGFSESISLLEYF